MTNNSTTIVSSVTTSLQFEMYNNSTNDTAASGRNEMLAKVEIAVLASILYLAVFGNAIVIIALLYRKRKLTRMQMFIIHLAIADISVALFQVLPQLVMDITFRFDGNNFLCKLVKYMQVATMYSSTYVLIMTAIDRYMSICYPLTSQTWTARRVHLMVAIAWILSGLFSVPQLVIFSYEKRAFDGVYDCVDNFDLENGLWQIRAYVTWIFASVYAFPFLILTFCYSKICHVVWISVNQRENTMNKSSKQRRQFKFSKSNSSSRNSNSHLQHEILNSRAHSKGLSKSKIKTVKLTLVVVICFVVCWAPFFITQMWSVYDLDAPYYTSHIMAIATLLASLNSCTNPWIYLAFSGRVCRGRKRKISKSTFMSSANTYMTDTMGDTMRMRKLTSDSFNRSFDDKEPSRINDDG